MGITWNVTEERDDGSTVQIEGDLAAGWATVGGVQLLRSFICRISPYAPGVRLELRVAVADETPRCTAVTFRTLDGEGDMPAGVIRDFRLQDLIELACSRAVEPNAAGRDGWRLPFHDPAWLAADRRARKAVGGARRRYTDDMMREVAEVYTANVTSWPTRAVRERFGVAQSTAQLYVKKARQRGFLTVPAPKGSGRP